MTALRSEGYEVVRLVDIADPRLPDRSVASIASHLDYLLLTADTDFARKQEFQPRRYKGIILLKDLTSVPDRILRRLLRFLAQTRSDACHGRTVVIDRRSVRFHR